MNRVILILIGLIGAYTATAGAEYLDGLIEPKEVVQVSSQVPGILDEVPVRRGDRVRKGQILARLKSGFDQVNVDLAIAQLEFSKRRAERTCARGAIFAQRDGRVSFAWSGGPFCYRHGETPSLLRWSRVDSSHCIEAPIKIGAMLADDRSSLVDLQTMEPSNS